MPLLMKRSDARLRQRIARNDYSATVTCETSLPGFGVQALEIIVTMDSRGRDEGLRVFKMLNGDSSAETIESSG